MDKQKPGGVDGNEILSTEIDALSRGVVRCNRDSFLERKMDFLRKHKNRNHPEAYALMNYECQDCGHKETIWNSRDGVTPFGVACLGCEKGTMHHVTWDIDRFDPNYIPPPGSRVFATLSGDDYKSHVEQYMDKMMAKDPKKVEGMFGSKEEAVKDFLSCQREGQPSIVTVPESGWKR